MNDNIPSIDILSNGYNHTGVIPTPDCIITTPGFADKFCNNLSGQASIDESVRSIQALIDKYAKEK